MIHNHEDSPEKNFAGPPPTKFRSFLVDELPAFFHASSSPNPP